MIKKLRVDHRLLHGQVAFSWTSALNVDCILIANDSVMKDELRKTTLKMAKPNGVKLVMKNIEDSIIYFLCYYSYGIMIIFLRTNISKYNQILFGHVVTSSYMHANTI